MTGNAFAQDWPGFGGPRHHRHRHGPPNWAFMREGRRGRPPFEDIEDLVALGRMWRGGPFGGRGFGPHRRGPGRARRGDVRLALLRLLAEEPRNGYQLIQAIEERSGGFWRPSPGSVYPTLSQLEDEGMIRPVDIGGARGFELTDAGRQHLESRSGEPAPWETPRDHEDNPLTELAPLVVGIGKATFQVASAGDRAQQDQARAVLEETRRSLYRILAGDAGDTGTDEESERQEM